jgi:hypothetical protein
MKRSFDDATLQAHLKKIRASRDEVRILRKDFATFIRSCPKDVLIEGGFKDLTNWLKEVDDILEETQTALPRINERAEQWDIDRYQELQENSLGMGKYGQKQLAILQCVRPLEKDGPLYHPPEVILENFANIEELKKQGYHYALYVHYSEDRKWIKILDKEWSQITEEEHLVIGIMEYIFIETGNQEDLDLLNQLYGARKAEYEAVIKAKQATDWAHVDKLYEENQNDPSLKRFLGYLKAATSQACKDIAGRGKDNIVISFAEAIINGSLSGAEFAYDAVRVFWAGYIRTLEKVPGLNKVVSENDSAWASGIKDKTDKVLGDVGYAVTNPKETAAVIGQMWAESQEERGVFGTLAYIAGEAVAGTLLGGGTVKGFSTVTGQVRFAGSFGKHIDDLPNINVNKVTTPTNPVISGVDDVVVTTARKNLAHAADDTVIKGSKVPDDLLKAENAASGGKVADGAGATRAGTKVNLKDMSASEYMRLEELGEELYKTIRNSTDDIEKIAKNTGWDKNKIEDIKNHMFKNEHLFDDGSVRQFDSNYWQAEAWKRMEKGMMTDLDELLLKHELYELELMKKYGSTYEQAHKKATELYDWAGNTFIN